VDPRAFVEPINLMPNAPPDFDKSMASSKWKDRKEALDAVYEIVKTADVQRINDDPSMDALVKQLAIRIKGDANVNVVMVASNIIGFLAKGVGKPFGRNRSVVVPAMLERMKERKASVSEAIGAGLDDFFQTVSSRVVRS
jgi:cytoskeleton-associated protein 5